MDTFELTVHRKFVDGDTAVVRQAISARTKAGKQYDNEYCWIYTCRDGQIARIEEYVDLEGRQGVRLGLGGSGHSRVRLVP